MTRRFFAAFGVLAIAASVSAASDKRFYGNAPGYLAAGIDDIRAVLPPAPQPGDARYEADRRIFRDTRAMIGGDRYALATRDAVINPPALEADFSCAVGVVLTPQNAPRTTAMASRAALDTGRRNSDAKDFFRRKRPFLIDQGAICQPKRELAGSYDYPSGHTAYGWTWALVLADLLPDRAIPILARGRAYGDSRFVCGAHNYSAVEAGKLGATTVMEAVRQTPAYQADAAAARAELRALIADPRTPRPTGCDAEARLVAQPVP